MRRHGEFLNENMFETGFNPKDKQLSLKPIVSSKTQFKTETEF